METDTAPGFTPRPRPALGRIRQALVDALAESRHAVADLESALKAAGEVEARLAERDVAAATEAGHELDGEALAALAPAAEPPTSAARRALDFADFAAVKAEASGPDFADLAERDALDVEAMATAGGLTNCRRKLAARTMQAAEELARASAIIDAREGEAAEARQADRLARKTRRRMKPAEARARAGRKLAADLDARAAEQEAGEGRA